MGEPPTTAGTNRPCAILYCHYSLLLMRGSEIPMGGSRRLITIMSSQQTAVGCGGVWSALGREEVTKSASVPHRQKRFRNRFLPKFNMSTPPVPSS